MLSYLNTNFQLVSTTSYVPFRKLRCLLRAEKNQYIVKCGDVEKMVCQEYLARLHGIGTTHLRRVAACATVEIASKYKRGLHNNDRFILDDIREKQSTCTPLCSSLCRISFLWTKRYTFFLQIKFLEQYMLLKSALYIKMFNCDNIFRICYDYFKAHHKYAFGTPRLHVCRGCVFFVLKIMLRERI